MALSFSLHRAARPLLHLDRSLHLGANDCLISHATDEQVAAAQAASGKLAIAQHAAAGITPRLQLVPQNATVYLGETCVFYITLGNQGSSTVTTIHVKVECSVEGGSCAVLYDNSATPLQQLPPLGRHDVIAQTDIKEAGQISLVASAVFTDPLGERKYHVQFFKLTSASPLSVRTRVRSLPHIMKQPVAQHGGGSSSGTDAAAAAGGASFASSGSSSSWGARTRCFLEVSVENSMQLPLVLHAVNLLAAAGIDASKLAICEPRQQQQQTHRQHHQQQQHTRSSLEKKQVQATGQLQNGRVDADVDTQLQHDLDADLAGLTPDTDAVKHHQPHHQQQQAVLQQQQHHEAPRLAVGDDGQSLVVVAPAFSHNYLFQIDHHMPGTSGGTPTASSSSSSTLLGRLELHWSSFDGKSGKLLTQPLSGPVPASGREVLMQLTQLRPLQQQQQQPPLAGQLGLCEPVLAVFSLTAADGPGQSGAGPLLVLYTDPHPQTAALAATSSDGGGGRSSSSGGVGTGRLSSSGGSGGGGSAGADQQQQRRRPGSSSSSSMMADVAVQGGRSRRVQRLAAGETVSVTFELLPLRPGWARLPTFVVVSEADGRLLDSVHDVQVLVS